ncbi:MAG: YjbQ family protein [Candidatus Altiarchaeota archaeon]|nr:YjbQ family protein [Candidatus Altiarchaeota archaeon]
MTVITKRIHVDSRGKSDIIDITEEVASFVSESKVKNGIVTIFVSGSTASVSTIEYEPGLLKDIPRALDKIAPYGPDYAHHDTWHDDNGASHVRATIMGPGITVPFENKKLTLGTWQQICVLDFDTRARKREVVLQIIGE